VTGAPLPKYQSPAARGRGLKLYYRDWCNDDDVARRARAWIET